MVIGGIPFLLIQNQKTCASCCFGMRPPPLLRTGASSKHGARPLAALISLMEPVTGDPLALPTDDPLARRRLSPRPDSADLCLLLLVPAQATIDAEEK
jgi:hypothetical protein